MNRQQRKELLTKEITNVLAKLGCIDTERAIVAFNNFIEVTLLDEFGDEASPYKEVTKNVELVMEMINDDYADIVMEDDAQPQKFKNSFAKGLKELNNLVNCHKR